MLEVYELVIGYFHNENSRTNVIILALSFNKLYQLLLIIFEVFLGVDNLVFNI